MAVTIIFCTGSVQHLTEVQGEPSLEQCQQIVGGHIEIVSGTRFGIAFQIILDEGGKRKGKPINLLASAIAEGIIAHDDYIVGDVLLLSEGNLLT